MHLSREYASPGGLRDERGISRRLEGLEASIAMCSKLLKDVVGELEEDDEKQTGVIKRRRPLRHQYDRSRWAYHRPQWTPLTAGK